MLAKMAREYMAVIRWLLKQPEPWIRDERQLLVPRERLVEMLDKHPYRTATDKLTTWRTLKWLDADDEHFTRLVRDEDGKRKRVIVLDLTIYYELCRLREMPVDEAT